MTLDTHGFNGDNLPTDGGGGRAADTATYYSAWNGPNDDDPAQAVDQHKKGLELVPFNRERVKVTIFNYSTANLWLRFGGDDEVFASGAFEAGADWAFFLGPNQVWEDQEFKGSIWGAWPDVPNGTASSITVPGGGWHLGVTAAGGLSTNITVTAGAKTLAEILDVIEDGLNAMPGLSSSLHFRARVLESGFWYETRKNDALGNPPPHTGHVGIWVYSDFGDGDGTTNEAPYSGIEFDFDLTFTEIGFANALGFTVLAPASDDGLEYIAPNAASGVTTPTLLGRSTDFTNEGG